MLNISTDIVSLSQAQKEALCGFILGFPASEVVSVEESEDEGVLTIPSFTFEDGGPTDEQVAAAFNVGTGKTVVIPPPPASSIPQAHIALVTPSNLDISGLPWDERIHASSRAKVADGTWRQKRGVDAGLVATVEAELKALMGLPAPVARIETTVFPGTVGALSDNGPLPVVIPPPPPSVQPIAQHCADHDQWYLDVCKFCPSPVASAPVIPPPPPPAPPAPVGDAFTNLLTFASSQIQQKKITMDEVSGIVQAMGVPALPLLRSRPDLLPGVHSALIELSAGR